MNELSRYTKLDDFYAMVSARGLKLEDFAHDCDEQTATCNCPGEGHARGDNSCPDRQKHDVCTHDLARWYELTGDPLPKWRMKIVGVAHVYKFVESEGFDLDDAVEKAENWHKDTDDDWIVDELKTNAGDAVHVAQNSWKRILPTKPERK